MPQAAHVPGDPGRGAGVAALRQPGGELVLVVDDDPLVRRALRRVLEAHGYRVAEAAGGEAALAQVDRLGPDLVLTDVVMPGMSGFELCSRIRERPETRLLPVILLTGFAEVSSRAAGLDAGADDFLVKPPDRVELLARVRSLLRVKHYTDQLIQAESVVLTLARSIEAKDPDTEGHCERLAAQAVALGKALALPEDDLRDLHFGGFLHDIGKVVVPDAILFKTGPLTPEEWEIVRRHPERGEHICRPIESFRGVLPIIRHHHERWDGTGYPDGLAGEAIPLTARVLQAVDIFDALTTRRPYKPALSQGEALAVLREEVRRGWRDPRVFEAFEDLLRSRVGGAP